jgi:hypothetical protein
MHNISVISALYDTLCPVYHALNLTFVHKSVQISRYSKEKVHEILLIIHALSEIFPL